MQRRDVGGEGGVGAQGPVSEQDLMMVWVMPVVREAAMREGKERKVRKEKLRPKEESPSTPKAYGVGYRPKQNAGQRRSHACSVHRP